MICVFLGTSGINQLDTVVCSILMDFGGIMCRRYVLYCRTSFTTSVAVYQHAMNAAACRFMSKAPPVYTLETGKRTPQVLQGVRKQGGRRRSSHEKIVRPAPADNEEHKRSDVFLSHQGRVGCCCCGGCCCGRRVCQQVYWPPGPAHCHLERQRTAFIVNADSRRCPCRFLSHTPQVIRVNSRQATRRISPVVI